MNDGCEKMINMLEQHWVVLKIYFGSPNVGCSNDSGLVAWIIPFHLCKFRLRQEPLFLFSGFFWYFQSRGVNNLVSTSSCYAPCPFIWLISSISWWLFFTISWSFSRLKLVIVGIRFIVFEWNHKISLSTYWWPWAIHRAIWVFL